METSSVLLALWEGNPPITGGYSSQKPVAWKFDVFFDLHLNIQDADDLRRHRDHYGAFTHLWVNACSTTNINENIIAPPYNGTIDVESVSILRRHN